MAMAGQPAAGIYCAGCEHHLPRGAFSGSQHRKPHGAQLCRACAPLPCLRSSFWGAQNAASAAQQREAVADVAELIDTLFTGAHQTCQSFEPARQELELSLPVWVPHEAQLTYAQRRAEREIDKHAAEGMGAVIEAIFSDAHKNSETRLGQQHLVLLPPWKRLSEQ